jgi:Leucine-rich repeat (LRR) protein
MKILTYSRIALIVSSSFLGLFIVVLALFYLPTIERSVQAHESTEDISKPTRIDPSYPNHPEAFCDQVTQIPQAECEALVALYNSTDGFHWTNNSGWLVSNLPCDWFGVVCIAINIDDLHVKELNLWGNNMFGTIPIEIGNLSFLEKIHFESNQLHGEIPAEFGNLMNLSNFYAENNQLSGKLPSELGDLSKLSNLRLYSNQLGGPLPVELGNIPSLLYINLAYNQITGTLPVEYGNLINLDYLDLSNNLLTGSIPPQIGNLTKITHLDLSDNQLNGTIPVELGNLSSVDYLILTYNQLSGSIPVEIGNLLNLKTLGMFGNDLTGEIPASLGNLTKLNHLNLGSNELTGTIPASLGNLVSLGDVLNLNINHLTGNIPPELGQLINLVTLDLSWNHLDGNIPTEIGNMANLKFLRLSGNRFNGSIPDSIGNLNKLQSLYLSNNAFANEIPLSITNLTSLTTLDLHYNKLYTTNSTVASFLAALTPTWFDTQTIPPSDLSITATNPTSQEIVWSPISYTQDSGYYDIQIGTHVAGSFTTYGTTLSKADSSYMLEGLLPGSTYHIKLRTFTQAHGSQQNDLWSEFTEVISGTTEMSGTQVTATPDVNTTLTYTDTSGNETIINIPAGAVTETVTIAYIPVESVSEPPGFIFTGQSFELNAYQDSFMVNDFTFDKPILITLNYGEQTQNEDSLLILYWDEQQAMWADAACGSYDRHLEENWLQVPICHLSLFALFSSEDYFIFLPVVHNSE